jgi:hypothetical protein
MAIQNILKQADSLSLLFSNLVLECAIRNVWEHQVGSKFNGIRLLKVNYTVT